MTARHELRAYDYVTRSFEAVKATLEADPTGVLGRATHVASRRAGDVAASLRASIGSLEVATDVTLDVGAIEVVKGTRGATELRVPLSWRAAHASALFPSMRATLSAYPLSKDETQLELVGSYTPPLGLLGDAVDALALGRIADASVHRFVADVAAYLSSAGR
jgi:hypothetical protein